MPSGSWRPSKPIMKPSSGFIQVEGQLASKLRVHSRRPSIESWAQGSLSHGRAAHSAGSPSTAGSQRPPRQKMPLLLPLRSAEEGRGRGECGPGGQQLLCLGTYMKSWMAKTTGCHATRDPAPTPKRRACSSPGPARGAPPTCPRHHKFEQPAEVLAALGGRALEQRGLVSGGDARGQHDLIGCTGAGEDGDGEGEREWGRGMWRGSEAWLLGLARHGQGEGKEQRVCSPAQQASAGGAKAARTTSGALRS